MRRKNLGLKVAALAVTGTIAVSPMTVRAEEGTANTAVSAPAGAAAVVGTASGTGTTAASGAAPAAGTSASTPAASITTAPATPAAPAAPAAGATATTGTTTTATAATPAAPVTVTEPAADPGTTVPNNVDTVVPDDTMQGTDIHFKADGEVKKTISFLGFTSEIKIPVHKDYNAEIKPEDTKEDK